MPTLIDAATALIELTNAYDLDPALRDAVVELNAAVAAELMQAGTVVKATPGAKRGPKRRVDYQAIRDAVAKNDKLPPEKRRTRDEIAAEFNTSAVTLRKAMRTQNQEQ